MGYAVIKNYIPKSLYPLKAPYPMEAEHITIHNTANDASAISEIEYMHGNKKETSYHDAVDDKYVVHGIPYERNAFAAGDGAKGEGNRKSIHIEICYSKSGGERYRKAEINAIDHVVNLLLERGWGVDRVKFHRDWSGKNCPHRIINEGREVAFKNEIARRLADKKKGVKGVATETIQLTPGQKRDKDLLVKYGIMAEDYQFTSSEQLFILNLHAQLIRVLEQKGALK